MQVVNCTTPANFFHVLRRQLKRDFRKPLVVFTPKSLLRHPRCISTMDDLIKGGFQEIYDATNSNSNEVRKLVFCSGKIYYELLAEQEQQQRNDLTLIRIEQLYPFPQKQFRQIITKYAQAKEYVWVQEEPENMGAYSFLLRTLKGLNLQLVSRPESASPATGSHHSHDREQRALVEQVFKKIRLK